MGMIKTNTFNINNRYNNLNKLWKISDATQSKFNNNKLEIKNLSVKIKKNETTILNNLNLTINPGEIHILMGRNGSGKSTLSKVIVGHPSYTISDGSILFKNTLINELEPDKRALNGIFMCFQNPVEIQGVKNL